MRLENSHNVLSALAILVPEADSVVSKWRRLYDWSAVRGLSSHITVLFPIDGSVCLEKRYRGLQTVFSEHASFDFVLREPLKYRNYVYFTQEPIDPFLKLTESAKAVLPDVVPYTDVSGCLTPHLTVAFSENEDVLQGIYTY